MATNEDTILSQYVPGFKANLNLSPQQTQTRLLPAVDSDLAYDTPGQFFNADDVGTTDPAPILSRIPDTPDKFIGMTRRVGAFAPFGDAQWIDKVDKARELEDPTSKIMMAMMAGRWRHVDNAIIAGLVGPAYGLAGPNAVPTPIAFPTAQIVQATDVAYPQDGEVLPTNGSQYGMSVSKIIHASLLLNESELEGERHAAISSFELADLLRKTPVTSTFYADVKALVKGEVNSFMGFTFHRLQSQRFLNAGAYSIGHDNVSPIYQCPFWVESALIYKGRPIEEASIFRRPDKSNRVQAYYELEDGAVRRYDQGVVRVDCYTGAAY